MILTENGVLKLMQRIKSFITAQWKNKGNGVNRKGISEREHLLTRQMGGGGTLNQKLIPF